MIHNLLSFYCVSIKYQSVIYLRIYYCHLSILLSSINLHLSIYDILYMPVNGVSCTEPEICVPLSKCLSPGEGYVSSSQWRISSVFSANILEQDEIFLAN